MEQQEKRLLLSFVWDKFMVMEPHKLVYLLGYTMRIGMSSIIKGNLNPQGSSINRCM